MNMDRKGFINLTSKGATTLKVGGRTAARAICSSTLRTVGIITTEVQKMRGAASTTGEATKIITGSTTLRFTAITVLKTSQKADATTMREKMPEPLIRRRNRTKRIAINQVL